MGGDVFSLGTMIFSMCHGHCPFTVGCKSLEEVQRRTREDAPAMQGGSPHLQALVYCMIDKNFQRRPSMAVAMKDPWFSEPVEDLQRKCLKECALSALIQRSKRTELRTALFADLASRENLAQMRELNDIFLQLDADNDGIITADEVRRTLGDRWSPERIENLITALVDSNTEEVSYEEFMGQLIAAVEPAENELLWRVFSEADRQKKGFLDPGDVEALLKRPSVAKVLGERDPAALLRQMNNSNNGKVRFQEFKDAMHGQSGGLRARMSCLLGPRTYRGGKVMKSSIIP